MRDQWRRFEDSQFVYPWSSDARTMLRKDRETLKKLKDGVGVSVPTR